MKAAMSITSRHRRKAEAHAVKMSRWNEHFEMHTMFLSDIDILKMRSKFNEDFFCRFSMAYLNYEAGEWEAAQDLLNSTRFLLGTEDGPSASLMRFLKSH